MDKMKLKKEAIDSNNKDLSEGKQTHMSASLHGEVEFHLENDEVPPPKDFKEKKPYSITFPVVGTSKDNKGHRYRTTGLPVVNPPMKQVGRDIELKSKGTRTEVDKKPYKV